MAFNANIPLATDQLSDSQGDIKDNFTSINDVFTLNHENFNAGAKKAGLHKLVQCFDQGGTPSNLLFNTKDMTLYNQESTLTTLQELFLIRGADTANEIPITAKNITNQWAYLPNGLILKWGTVNTVSFATSKVVTYQTGATYAAFSTATLLVFGQEQTTGITDANGYFVLQNKTALGFTYNWIKRDQSAATATTFNLQWLAIGY